MVDLLIGILLMAGVWALVEYVRKQSLRLAWWHWLLAILGLVYTAFVVKVIADFIAEGAPMAATVMGLILGLVAVVGAVLFGRFVLKTNA